MVIYANLDLSAYRALPCCDIELKQIVGIGDGLWNDVELLGGGRCSNYDCGVVCRAIVNCIMKGWGQHERSVGNGPCGVGKIESGLIGWSR